MTGWTCKHYDINWLLCPKLSPTTALNLPSCEVCTAAESVTPGKGDQGSGNYSHVDLVRAYLATMYFVWDGRDFMPHTVI